MVKMKRYNAELFKKGGMPTDGWSIDCAHKRENHMGDKQTGRTDCDFPGCNCHEYRE